jgi:hypothetical protein
MANALFDAGRDGFLGAVTGHDWDADARRVGLVDDTDVTFDLAVNDFWDDLVAGLVSAAAESGNMTSLTKDGTGVADADDVTLSSVTGDAADYVICWYETGTDSTQALIFALDSATTGLPVTPNGGDITIAWDNGANKIFKL